MVGIRRSRKDTSGGGLASSKSVKQVRNSTAERQSVRADPVGIATLPQLFPVSERGYSIHTKGYILPFEIKVKYKKSINL